MGNQTSTSSSYLHVLSVAAHSPCAVAGIEPFFDFLVTADGHPVVRQRVFFRFVYFFPLTTLQTTYQLRDLCRANVGKPIVFSVYNGIDRAARGASVWSPPVFFRGVV